MTVQAQALSSWAGQDPEVRFREFLSEAQYPCLGARSVVKRSGLDVVVVPSLVDLDDGDGCAAVCAALRSAAARTVPLTEGIPVFRSTAVIFRGPVPRTEQSFEDAMWSVLDRLTAEDTEPWADEVSSDPGDPRFGFSFAGTPFFVVGMHPQASRRARRAPSPTLVFNAHAQFEALRRAGGFERMRDTIRRRDVRSQGSVNPMMADHGAASEARQYSGRAVPKEWLPPRAVVRTVRRPTTDGEATPRVVHGRCPSTPATT